MAERPNRRIETRQEKFERLKETVRSGKYKIDPESVAGGILGIAEKEGILPAEKIPAPQIIIEKDAMEHPHVLQRTGLTNKILGAEVDSKHPNAVPIIDPVTEKTHHYAPISDRKAQVLLRFLKSKQTQTDSD